MTDKGHDWPTESFGPNMTGLADYWTSRCHGRSIPLTSDIVTPELDRFKSIMLLIDFRSGHEIGAYFAFGGMFDWHGHKFSSENYLALFEPKSRKNARQLVLTAKRQPCGICGTVEHFSLVKNKIYQRSFLALPVVDRKGAVEYFINLDDEPDFRIAYQGNTSEGRGRLEPGFTRFVETTYLDTGFGLPDFEIKF